MNYIFLDVDGVLNNKKHYKKLHEKYGGKFFMEQMPFNPRSLKNLRKIVDKTDGQIIISSSWRKNDRCMAVLSARLMEYGMRIKGCTDDFNSRGKEIIAYMQDKAEPYSNYIVIDDENYDLTKYINDCHIVKINWFDGLTRSKMHEAVEKMWGNDIVNPYL